MKCRYCSTLAIGLAVCLALAAGLTGPAAQAAPRHALLVFAGSATKPAQDETAVVYQKETGQKVEATFAGSGTVLTQVEQEHYGDLYIPGSDIFMDKAVKDGAVIPWTRKNLCYLVPVILVAKGNPLHIHSLADLARPGLRVVIGQQGAVCLGNVAEAILKKAGLTKQVHKQVVSFALSCSQICNSLVLGQADAIIGWDVYQRQHPTKMQIVPIPKKYAKTYTVQGAVVTWSPDKKAALAYLDFLAGPEGQKIFAKHGYTTKLPKTARKPSERAARR